MIWRWLLHALGIDTQQSMPYDFWSGVGTQLSLVLAATAVLRKHQCHQRRCPRIGRHVVDGTPWCNRHHHAARGRP